jgi:hypothetical protein
MTHLDVALYEPMWQVAQEFLAMPDDPQRMSPATSALVARAQSRLHS